LDTETLVDDKIEDCRKLLEALAAAGFEMTAAFWMRRNDDGKWRFYIVSPLVDTAGIFEAYRRVQPLIRRRVYPPWADPADVRLIGPSDPLAKDVLNIYAGPRAPRDHPIRWTGIWLGNSSIDGAYLYPLPAAATV
jgi:hypothetical protein